MSKFQDFEKTLKNKNINIENKRLNEVIQKYSFHYVSEKLSLEQNQILEQNLKSSKIIVIGHYKEDNHFIICFKNTILFVNQLLLKFVHCIFSNKHEIYFLHDSKDLFDQQIQLKYNNAKNTNLITNALLNLSVHLLPKKIDKNRQIWLIICQCISGYLIQNAYHKLNKDRVSEFFDKNQQMSSRIFDEDEYVELFTIGKGSLFLIYLIYLIDSEELVALKKPDSLDDEVEKLVKREKHNYESMMYPSIPKFYGTTKKNGYIVIEYINGHTLNDKNLHLSDVEKYAIIYQLIDFFKYSHDNHFIYRDLKPNNVIIDENKTTVLIDFDRMISEEERDNRESTTIYFLNEEFNSLNYTNKSDIYLIGKMIYYIMNEIKTINLEALKSGDFEMDIQLRQISVKYTKDNVNERPSSTQLLNDFCSFINSKKIDLNHNHSTVQTIYGIIYKNSCEIYKSIHCFTLAADQNNMFALVNLADAYKNAQNMNKCIHYYKIAANNNSVQAQLSLGCIYFNGESVPRDIDKSIHYFLLAANQNDSQALCNLGCIYFYHKSDTQDIDKGLQYYTLSAKQNNSQALQSLGRIYFYGNKVPRDIDKGIQYFKLAANLNNSEAQHCLGFIYIHDKSVQQDISKGIHYFLLAANQNDSSAQYFLGLINYIGLYIQQNIYIGIEYMKLVQKNGFLSAYFFLGFIYHEGKHFKRDIKKAMHLYKEASSFNDQFAKNNIGILYKNGFENEVPKSWQTAKIYFLEAIKQNNDTLAKYNLAHICIFDDSTEEAILESIEYLVESFEERGFQPSGELLCLILLKMYGFDIDAITKELSKYTKNINDLITFFFDTIESQNLDDQVYFEKAYTRYKYINYLYNELDEPIISSDIFEHEIKHNQNSQNQNNQLQENQITSEFYEGFGIPN